MIAVICRPSRGRAALGVAVMLSASGASTAVYAQTRSDGSAGSQARNGAIGSESVPVNERLTKGYAPVGIPLGGFRLYPSVTSNVGFDSNIYARDTLEVSDGFVSIVPRASLRSDWARHALTLSADGSVRRFFNRSLENYEQFGGQIDGRLDVTSRSVINASTSYGRRIEPRGQEGDTLTGGTPISYRLFTASADGAQDLGRMRLTAGVDYANYRYNDAVIGGVQQDLAFRNFRSLTGNAQINYRVAPAISVFVSGSLNRLSYPNAAAIADRNSHGYSVIGGVAFGLTSVLTGEAGLGYIRQDFDNPLFPRVSGLNYRASLTWNPTELTTVTGRLQRSVQRSPLIGVAGIVLSQATAQVDHELLRNLILRGSANYSVGTYTGLPREDRRWALSASARYLVSRNISMSVTNNFVVQNAGQSAAVGRAYRRNIILFGVTLSR